jgi:WD40 repeat protein
VRVYEATPEPHIRVLQSATGRPATVALSRDGSVLAITGAKADEVLLIDPMTVQTLRRVRLPEQPVDALVFSIDGNMLFESRPEGHITQREVSSGATLREFDFPDPGEPAMPANPPAPITPRKKLGPQNLMRLSPDGTLLARSHDDGRIGLWDVPSGSWLGWLESGSTQRSVIDFSPDGRTLVACSPEDCVVWDTRTLRKRHTLGRPTNYPSLRVSPDGTTIAHGARNGSIELVDSLTGRLVTTNNTAATAAMEMVFHPSGTILFAAAFDPSIRLWDTRSGRELLSLQKHTALVRSLLVTPDGSTLISSDVSGLVLAWDLTHFNPHIRKALAYRHSHQGGG